MPTATRHKETKLGKRAIAALVVCALFAAITVKPAPARADTQTVVIYAGIGLGIYLAVIIIATKAVYGSVAPDSSAVPITSLECDEPRSFPIKPGTRCPQRDGQVALVCW